jgi:hypothetical protein
MYHFICRHRNDGLYDFVLFVRCSKQEISERAVQHRKFWCFNVPVVYFNLLFLLLFGTFWRTLGTSRTPDQKFAGYSNLEPCPGNLRRGKAPSILSKCLPLKKNTCTRPVPVATTTTTTTTTTIPTKVSDSQYFRCERSKAWFNH